MSVEFSPTPSCPLMIDGVSVYAWDHPPFSGIFSKLPDLPTQAENIGRQVAAQPAIVGIDGLFPSADLTPYVWPKNTAPEEYKLTSQFGKNQLILAGDFITSEGLENVRNKSDLSALMITGAVLLGLGGLGLSLCRKGPAEKFSRRKFLKMAAMGTGGTIMAVTAGAYLNNRYFNRLAEIINSCQDTDLLLQSRDNLLETSPITHARTLVGIGKINSLPPQELSERGIKLPHQKAYIWGLDHLLPHEIRALAGQTEKYPAFAKMVYHTEAAGLVASEVPKDAAVEKMCQLRFNLSAIVFYRTVPDENQVGFQFAVNNKGVAHYFNPDILAQISGDPRDLLHKYELMLD